MLSFRTPVKKPQLERTLFWAMFAVLLAFSFSFKSFAAEIEGLTTSNTDELAREDRRAELIGIFTGNDPDRTVLHFSVLPSIEDPNVMETRVYVQRRGAQEVCISITAPDVITRGYTPDADTEFEPTLPSVITTDESNETGDLIGFNEKKLVIRPHDPTFEFDTDQCFAVGEFLGCFVEGDLSCDEILEENQEVCVTSNGALGACSAGIDHAQAVEDLLKTIATNALAPPIITAAGPLGPETEFEPDDIFDSPEISLPGTPSTNIDDILSSGSSGGSSQDLVQVPPVRGLTQAEAIAKIEAADLLVGEIIVDDSLTPIVTGSLSIIGTAHAQDGTCEANKADRTDPPAGTFVNRFLELKLFMCGDVVDVPEPSSTVIFLTALLLLIVVYRCRNSNLLRRK